MAKAADTIIYELMARDPGFRCSEDDLFDVQAGTRGLVVTLADGRVRPLAMKQTLANSLARSWAIDVEAKVSR